MSTVREIPDAGVLGCCARVFSLVQRPCTRVSLFFQNGLACLLGAFAHSHMAHSGKEAALLYGLYN